MSRSPRQQAGDQRRTLRSMRKRLLELSGIWDGVDEFNRGALEELADRMEWVAAQLTTDEVEP
jgi:hypothetical protein